MGLSLFQRILIWLFLNLLLVAAFFLGYVNIRISLPADSLLAGSLGERFQILPYQVGRDLSNAPFEDWQELLQRRAREAGVDLYLLSRQGRLVAGTRDEVPGEVRQAAREYLESHQRRQEASPQPLGQGGPRQGPRPGPGQGPLPRPKWGPGQGPRPGPGPALGPIAGGPPPRPGFPVHAAAAGRGQVAAFSLRTSDPSRYWAGLPIMVLPRDASPPLRGVLVASSDSMTGHGLFFDPAPWVAGIAAVLALSVLWWWPLIRSMTRPLARITRATEKIAAGDFSVELPDRRSDEIGRLSRAINQMTRRLRALIGGHKQFLGNVAHELTSPVARIKLGLSILEREIPPAQRGRLKEVMDDAEHMSGLLDELLSFSRAERNPAQARLGDVALTPLLERALARESQPGVAVTMESGQDVWVHADPDLVVRAMGNLIRNAIRYAGRFGPIQVRASRSGDQVRIVVVDQGPGVAEEDLGRLFEPFHQARGGPRGADGVGLGLSIVKTCVEACRGRVTCRNRPEGGFAVEVVLVAGEPPGEDQGSAAPH